MEISGFEAVTDMKSPAKHRRSLKHALPVPVPIVSQETKDRLYAEAREHLAFEKMGIEDLRASIDYRLDAFLSQQPWWYGHTGGPGGADVPRHAAQKKHAARREKAQHDRDPARHTGGTPIEGDSREETEQSEEEKGGRGTRQEGEQISTAV